jgi:hypothetical protein
MTGQNCLLTWSAAYFLRNLYTLHCYAATLRGRGRGGTSIVEGGGWKLYVQLRNDINNTGHTMTRGDFV